MDEAMQLASTGHLEASEKILLEMEKRYPEDTELKYRLGLVLLRQKKLPDAQRRLESLVRLVPQSPQAWLAVARVRLQVGQMAEAAQAIEQANLLAPDDPVVWRASAMFYEEAGEFATAAQYELRWSKSHPEDKVSPLRAMEYFLRADQADPAIELGTQVLAREDDARVHNLLGRAFRLKHNPAKAVEELQRAVQLDPGTPGHYVDLVQLFLDHRTPEPALMILENALQKFPTNLEILRLLGLAHYAVGDQAKALDTFLEIIDLDPNSQVGYASLETLLPYAGDRLGEIIKKLQGYCQRHSSDPLGYYLLAAALVARSGESAESEKLLRQAILVEQSFWPAYFELHKKLERDGDLGEAIQVLKKTIELNPGHAQAHYALARIYGKLGEREKAIEERKAHHKLVLEEREATEKRQAAYPRLPYKLRTSSPRSG